MVSAVKQVQKQGVDGRCSPRHEPFKPQPYLGVWLARGVQHRAEQGAEAAKPCYLRLDVVLGCQPVQPGLLGGVGIGLLHTRVSLHKVKPEQQLQLGT